MKNVITLTPPDGDEGFTNAGSMIDAIKAHRARQAARAARQERIEEQAANKAAKSDPKTKEWIWAAVQENWANN